MSGAAPGRPTLRQRRHGRTGTSTDYIPFMSFGTHGSVTADEELQARANEAWGERDYVATYAHRRLRPVEVILLLRHAHALRGGVLELGCGAGRVSGYLLELSGSYLGLDISPRMVAHCRRAYPGARFETGDLRELSTVDTGAWDAVVAPYNVIDVLDDAARRSFLMALHGMIVPDGLLVFSSHNEGAAHTVSTRPELRWRDPLRLAVDLSRYPRRARNRRRRAAGEVRGPGYAIRNDAAHDFSLLHYYIARDAQDSQLTAHGFQLLECLDLDGRRVAPGDAAAHAGELHYVARRLA